MSCNQSKTIPIFYFTDSVFYFLVIYILVIVFLMNTEIFYPFLLSRCDQEAWSVRNLQWEWRSVRMTSRLWHASWFGSRRTWRRKWWRNKRDKNRWWFTWSIIVNSWLAVVTIWTKHCQWDIKIYHPNSPKTIIKLSQGNYTVIVYMMMKYLTKLCAREGLFHTKI